MAQNDSPHAQPGDVEVNADESITYGEKKPDLTFLAI
jgi:hypothetical protein